MNKFVLISIGLMVVAQTLSFLQIQSQFFWEWAKNNPFYLSLIGVPLSYILITAVKFCALGFNGQIWPSRLIGFAIGAIVFTVLASTILKEPINTKTLICLLLSSAILGVQIFMK